MFRRKKTPNYLQPIIIILILMVLSLIYLAFQSHLIQQRQLAEILAAQKQLSDLISSNLVSYWPQEDLITQPRINETSPSIGKSDATVTIVEYSSFLCDYSAQIQPLLRQIMEKYQGQVRLIWKDLPLEEIYPGATLAHQAARCAQKQNQFWAYHNLLWQNQDDLSANNLKKLARAINLNERIFESCLKDQETINLTNKDIKEADALMIPGAPHFYINHQEILGLASLEDFERLIKIELNR